MEDAGDEKADMSGGGGEWGQASKKKQKQLPTGMVFLPSLTSED